MCTVTYISKGKEGFIFTSNRDEAPKRSANDLFLKKQNGKRILYPKDPLASGTWIAVSDRGQLVCILNGAFVKHHHRPPYRLSRGLMALEFFNYDNLPHFFQSFDFHGIEPFTMVIFDEGMLYELRWDETEKHLAEKDISGNHIWASCTLYPPLWEEKRRIWFSDWQNNTPVSDQQSILDFHKNAGEGNPYYDLVMNREDKVRTVSITSIIKNREGMDMHHEDVLTGEVKGKKLPFKTQDSTA